MSKYKDIEEFLWLKQKDIYEGNYPFVESLKFSYSFKLSFDDNTSEVLHELEKYRDKEILDSIVIKIDIESDLGLKISKKYFLNLFSDLLYFKMFVEENLKDAILTFKEYRFPYSLRLN